MTRLLTEEEVEYIIDFVKPQPGIPIETAESIVSIQKERFQRQLHGQKVYPEIIPQLKAEIERLYRESLITPGESVGITAAHSIGERNTQMTLNTFHKAGQSEKAVIAGVPRFQELINATKNPKVVNSKVFFKSGNSTVQELRHTIGHNIVGLKLSELILDTRVCIKKVPEAWYQSYKILYNDAFMAYENCLSFRMNIDKLFEYKIDMEYITAIIEGEFDDMRCVFSPPVYGILDVFVNTADIHLPEDRLLFVTQENAPEIYLEECVQPFLENMHICGIQGIKQLYYIRENGEWIIETDGSNFKQLLACSMVDETRTFSNDVWDIYNVLGIEAAREFLIEEFMSVMDGINICHTKLLVDRMTHAGTISSISRYTLKKDEAGPIGKASFEESLDNFLKAAAHGDEEPTTGVSASIICGKMAKMGTGMVELKMDLNMLPE